MCRLWCIARIYVFVLFIALICIYRVTAQNVCDIDGHAGGVGKSVIHNSVGMNAHERKCLRCSWSLGHRVATSSSWTRGVD